MKNYKGCRIEKTHTTITETRYCFGRSYEKNVFLYKISGDVHADCYEKLSTLKECRDYINSKI